MKKVSLIKLELDVNFKPCQIEEGHELMTNGIFVFNITKMNEYARNERNMIPLVDYEVTWHDTNADIDNYPFGDILTSNPGIIAEISPGNFNLIDGRHRATKIYKHGGDILKCYKFEMSEHIRFLSSTEAYNAYVDYWNGKVDEITSNTRN